MVQKLVIERKPKLKILLSSPGNSGYAHVIIIISHLHGFIAKGNAGIETLKKLLG